MEHLNMIVSELRQSAQNLAVARKILKSSSHGSTPVAKPPEKTIKKVIEEWMEWRKTKLFKFDVDQQHLCTVMCQTKRWIQCLDQDRDVFGCLMSGRTHTCRRNLDCHARFINPSSFSCCVFSLYEIQTTMHGNVFEDVEKARDDERGVGAGENEDHQENHSSQHQQQPLKKLPRKKKMRKLKVASSVLGIYDSLDTNLHNDARMVIRDLLWNTERRSMVDASKLKMLKKRANTAVSKYMKTCSRTNTVPCVPKIIDIISEKMSSVHRNVPLPFDADLETKYARLIVNLWTAMEKTAYGRDGHVRTSFKQHVIAALYMMKVGKKIGPYHYLILPDEFLQRNLPPQQDLEWYGTKEGQYSRKDITAGRNTIQEAFKNIYNVEEVIQYVRGFLN